MCNARPSSDGSSGTLPGQTKLPSLDLSGTSMWRAEEQMRYRQKQFLQQLLLCFLFSLVATFWLYVLFNAPP